MNNTESPGSVEMSPSHAYLVELSPRIPYLLKELGPKLEEREPQCGKLDPWLI